MSSRLPALDASLERLLMEPALVVEQSSRHWGEILVGYEQRNAYSVANAAGARQAFVAEESDALVRFGLGSRRPFVAHVVMPDGSSVLEFHRPFRWFLPDLEVRTVGGDVLGRVETRFNLLHRTFDLHDRTGDVFGRLSGPLLKPWTFHLLAPGGTESGSIRKKWRGMATEAFTDADTFDIDFGVRRWTPAQRAVILGAAILIDFSCFERSGS